MHLTPMTIAKLLHQLQRGEQFAASGLVGDIEQHVRGAPERRDHDNRTTGLLAGDHVDNTVDRGGIGHRGTAELADDHEATNPSS